MNNNNIDLVLDKRISYHKTFNTLINWLCKAYETTVLHTNHIFTTPHGIVCDCGFTVCWSAIYLLWLCIHLKGFTSFIPEIMDGRRGEETYLLGDDSLILSP